MKNNNIKKLDLTQSNNSLISRFNYELIHEFLYLLSNSMDCIDLQYDKKHLWHFLKTQIKEVIKFVDYNGDLNDKKYRTNKINEIALNYLDQFKTLVINFLEAQKSKSEEEQEKEEENYYYISEIDLINDFVSDEFGNVLNVEVAYETFDILRDLLLKEIQNLEIYKTDYFNLAWDLITQNLAQTIKIIDFKGDLNDFEYRRHKIDEIVENYQDHFIDLFNEELEKALKQQQEEEEE